MKISTLTWTISCMTEQSFKRGKKSEYWKKNNNQETTKSTKCDQKRARSQQTGKNILATFSQFLDISAFFTFSPFRLSNRNVFRFWLKNNSQIIASFKKFPRVNLRKKCWSTLPLSSTSACKQSPEAFYRKTKPQFRGDRSDIIVIDGSWVYLFASDIVLVCGRQINEAKKWFDFLVVSFFSLLKIHYLQMET